MWQVPFSRLTRKKVSESHGLAYRAIGQVEKAIEYYENVLTIGKEIKDPRIINFCKKNLRSLKNSGD
ncbi:MAG: tetratricopeptide repeat protein [Euryarchaeota archaeon]|nr:tetratricopeptide repeat protein [Euryarchaeota archaeon]